MKCTNCAGRAVVTFSPVAVGMMKVGGTSVGALLKLRLLLRSKLSLAVAERINSNE